jgi:hypothetical protein
MKRWKAWALAWLLAATPSALLLQAPSAHADELLVNGGFENGVAPWTANGGHLQAPPGSLGRDGSVAGVFVTDDSAYHYVRQCVPVSEGSAYKFQGYAAGIGETPLVSSYVLISWYGGAECHGEELGTTGDTAEAVILEPAGSWHLLVLEIGAPPVGGRSARVGIAVEQQNVTVYLDDFSFTGPAAPTPTPSATPSPTPSPTASPSPSPGPTASPTPRPVASPSPTAVPTATEVPSAATPRPSIPTPTAGLVNAGFEEAGGDGTPVGWRKYGGELTRSSAAAWEGHFAGAFTSRTISTKWAFQTVAVQGGESYILSGYALKNDANVEAAYLRLSWYASSDGSGTAIDSVDSTTCLTDDSPEFRFLTSGPVVAPAEAASANVRLMLDPGSEAEGTVYFDAISFGETSMPPEPVETPGPSPTLASSESPPASAVAPAAPSPASPAEPGPSSSPNSVSPSPAVLDAASGGPEPTVPSPNGSSQNSTVSEGGPTRTPVVLYRELRGDQSSQAEGRLATASDDGGGFSLTLLVLATALPVAAVAVIGPFVWRRWRKRARPP